MSTVLKEPGVGFSSAVRELLQHPVIEYVQGVPRLLPVACWLQPPETPCEISGLENEMMLAAAGVKDRVWVGTFLKHKSFTYTKRKTTSLCGVFIFSVQPAKCIRHTGKVGSLSLHVSVASVNSVFLF